MTEKPSTEAKSSQPKTSERVRLALSWRAMLVLIMLAILLAAACAYLLVNPFFHQHPR
jgi:hypothetical protein